jgi:hypothetical protein
MGLESFQLALRGGRLRSEELVRELLNDTAISRDQGFLSSSTNLHHHDSSHKIEMDVDAEGSRLRVANRTFPIIVS